jgi:hypothetical protein
LIHRPGEQGGDDEYDSSKKIFHVADRIRKPPVSTLLNHVPEGE